MANRRTVQPPEMELDDSLWDSPVKPNSKNTQENNTRARADSRQPYQDHDTKDAGLRQELASVRKVNEAMEGVLENLERAKANMKTVNQTVGAASTLLNTWTRILSQTEHNQRLILDPSWQGASQDVADLEAESQAKQQAALRKEAEEQERKAAAARKAEEDERKRAVEATGPPKSSLRGRGRVPSRGVASHASTRAPSSGYGTTDTSMSSVGRGSYSSRRPGASSIGRVSRGTTRGRG